MTQHCLILLSSAKEGVSAQSFIQCCTLVHSSFQVQLATPGGKYPEYLHSGDSTTKWMEDFKTKALAVPMNVSIVDASRYSCLVIPHCPGAPYDLAASNEVALILAHFMQHSKPICAVGHGVAALLATASHPQQTSWPFKDVCLTAPTLFDQSLDRDFSQCPVLLEDGLRDGGARYTGAAPGAPHVVIDRHLVTGQNELSTLTAVQNLVLICNQLKKTG
ncbi:glutamine amidotransferase-like class 1 domain-containing protein 1 [Amphibalanus amphitrite]|uniref:glutamine amidotransferase-like class 1 domain-containing protein 1 n=1 Tax=Amphibalanus amphitrite TaxID=1232801 RepID=UPI001C925C83|nr:glutamine amidotransferase-like class 1 domain-containing protein 1 [Amphibalanus amphitrite]XP_043232143.1 glutamine amidotransferase-like class 1 domain-containing protein 1 [Amphibalanus amphitrite]XP_043232152.1 glutamine amidotransferase-like class 1 domain-containing protein 1 [Amphibalanus amphitrite]XP_043232161.1 glutamine amidotransferase-like class 1 domain-containing protein 1 [Amphibalanus amphitrite]